MRETQGEDFSQSPSFEFASWGNPGFDAPNDHLEGELGTMDPPLAVHSSGRVAFGIDTLIIDLSEDSTPPEILDHFGTDESFEGVYCKALQVYYADANKDFALNFAVRDALISFKGEVSLEAELDLLFADAPFAVTVTMFNGKQSISVNPGTASGYTWAGGSATVPPNVAMYLQIAGGVPPFTTTVDYTPNGGAVQHHWNESTRTASFNPAPTANSTGTLAMKVVDSSGTNDVVTIRGGSSLPTVTVNGTAYTIGEDRQVLVDVEPGATATQIQVNWGAGNLPGEFDLLFDFNKPDTEALESTYASPTPGGADPIPDDTVFLGNAVPAGVPGGDGHSGADALRYWAANALDLSKPISITGKASNEGHADKGPYDLGLSGRRSEIARRILAGVSGAPAPSVAALGETADTTSNPRDRVAVVTGTPKNSTAWQLSGKLQRSTTPTPPTPTTPAAPQPPGPPTNKKPATLRRLSIRVRLERNVPVMVELSGEIDFETKMEDALRGASGQSGSLDLTQTAAASKNPTPADGVVDFTLNVTYDTATPDLTETLTIEAAPADEHALLRKTTPSP